MEVLKIAWPDREGKQPFCVEKGQRNDTADECSPKMKISHACFLSDLTLKEAPSLKGTVLSPIGVECVNSESGNSTQVSPGALQPLHSTCDTVSSTRHCHTENGGSLPAKFCNSLEQHAVKVPPPVYLPHLFFNKVPQLEKEVTVAEYCKQNHSSGSVMQKWIPIGVKDPELTTSARFGNSSPDPSDGRAGEDHTLRKCSRQSQF
uniref:Uncharacterized protein n=1 Tax=Populus alba TaxID=43335 RepID=A0A4U5NL40_POPAL|nr:hypothetical protein D5086_0000258970 [Populus alba]